MYPSKHPHAQFVSSLPPIEGHTCTYVNYLAEQPAKDVFWDCKLPDEVGKSVVVADNEIDNEFTYKVRITRLPDTPDPQTKYPNVFSAEWWRPSKFIIDQHGTLSLPPSGPTADQGIQDPVQER